MLWLCYCMLVRCCVLSLRGTPGMLAGCGGSSKVQPGEMGSAPGSFESSQGSLRLKWTMLLGFEPLTSYFCDLNVWELTVLCSALPLIPMLCSVAQPMLCSVAHPLCVCVYIYIYIYIHTHTCTCMYVYIYIYRERERLRTYIYIYIYIYREREMCVHIHMYTYIYIYIYRKRERYI